MARKRGRTTERPAIAPAPSVVPEINAAGPVHVEAPAAIDEADVRAETSPDETFGRMLHRVYGLAPEHMASGRIDTAAPEGRQIVVVTHGGVKLRLPADEERARCLTESERDGQVRSR
jgi:hypothetical protein